MTKKFTFIESQRSLRSDVTRAVMEGAAKLSVPLVVETGVGANWMDAK